MMAEVVVQIRGSADVVHRMERLEAQLEETRASLLAMTQRNEELQTTCRKQADHIVLLEGSTTKVQRLFAQVESWLLTELMNYKRNEFGSEEASRIVTGVRTLVDRELASSASFASSLKDLSDKLARADTHNAKLQQALQAATRAHVRDREQMLTSHHEEVTKLESRIEGLNEVIHKTNSVEIVRRMRGFKGALFELKEGLFAIRQHLFTLQRFLGGEQPFKLVAHGVNILSSNVESLKFERNQSRRALNELRQALAVQWRPLPMLQPLAVNLGRKHDCEKVLQGSAMLIEALTEAEQGRVHWLAVAREYEAQILAERKRAEQRKIATAQTEVSCPPAVNASLVVGDVGDTLQQQQRGSSGPNSVEMSRAASPAFVGQPALSGGRAPLSGSTSSTALPMRGPSSRRGSTTGDASLSNRQPSALSPRVSGELASESPLGTPGSFTGWQEGLPPSTGSATPTPVQATQRQHSDGPPRPRDVLTLLASPITLPDAVGGAQVSRRPSGKPASAVSPSATPGNAGTRTSFVRYANGARPGVADVAVQACESSIAEAVNVPTVAPLPSNTTNSAGTAPLPPKDPTVPDGCSGDGAIASPHAKSGAQVDVAPDTSVALRFCFGRWLFRWNARRRREMERFLRETVGVELNTTSAAATPRKRPVSGRRISADPVIAAADRISALNSPRLRHLAGFRPAPPPRTPSRHHGERIALADAALLEEVREVRNKVESARAASKLGDGAAVTFTTARPKSARARAL